MRKVASMQKEALGVVGGLEPALGLWQEPGCGKQVEMGLSWQAARQRQCLNHRLQLQFRIDRNVRV